MFPHSHRPSDVRAVAFSAYESRDDASDSQPRGLQPAPKIMLSLSSFHTAASREDSAGRSRPRVLSGTRGATPTPVRPSQGLTSFARPACLETCFHQGCQQG